MDFESEQNCSALISKYLSIYRVFRVFFVDLVPSLLPSCVHGTVGFGRNSAMRIKLDYLLIN